MFDLRDADDDEFGVGMTLDQLIEKLSQLRKEHGNLHVAVTANSKDGNSWYGMLDEPSVITVKRNTYKSCYQLEENSDLKVVVLD